MTNIEPKPCLREPNNCVEGDQLYIECKKKGRWELIQKSGQHKGSSCTVKKNAKAIVLRKFTNCYRLLFLKERDWGPGS